MARHDNASNIYEVAQTFLNNCLLKDGSLLFDGASVWSLDVLKTFHSSFVNNPATGERTFIEKLKDQIGKSEQKVCRLAAEMLSVYYLFPYKERGDTKLDEINEILSWQGDNLPNDHPVSIAFDKGVGGIGQAISFLYEDIVFFIDFAMAWKRLSRNDQEVFANDPWLFQEFISNSSEKARSRTLYRMLLHLLFPDTFESVVSKQHKQMIIKTFYHLITNKSDNEDRNLLTIRNELKEKGLLSNDESWISAFYISPLKEAWIGNKDFLNQSNFKKSISQLTTVNQISHPSKKETFNIKNSIYYGPPGTGKTYQMQQLKKDYKETVFITFHQSYGYEEFIEGLRPVLNNDVKESNIRYEIRDGIFKNLCRRAYKEPEQNFAIFIDEINRGNISKIFGELITLIEADKREGGATTQVKLPYSGEEFSIPSNIDIFGTMNTADRSLALLDTALRRRFDFIATFPDITVLTGLIISMNGEDIHIAKILENINARIEALYDRDHTIGHAYFTHLKEIPDASRFDELVKVFRNRILPLLEEYFFEDWQKIRLVLGDNQKPDDQQFIKEYPHESNLERLFGNNHDIDTYSAKKCFYLNENALTNPLAYIAIYDVKADG